MKTYVNLKKINNMKNKIAIVTVHAGESKFNKNVKFNKFSICKTDLHLIVSKNYDNRFLLYKSIIIYF